MHAITLRPIGTVRSTPIEIVDDDWEREESSVELDAERFSEDSLLGLEGFSHVEVLFYMDRIDPAKIETGARHPRNNPSWPKVGIFAQRGKNRPNPIGLTVCQIVRVDGLRLYVNGLDAVDGSPVLDLKPWVAQLGPRGKVDEPRWMSELMRGYGVKAE